MDKSNPRTIDRFILDPDKKILWASGEPVKIQPKEVELLCVLTENPGEVVTRDELLARVWSDSIVEENNLSRHIFGLRRIFKAYGVPAETIQTVPRRGYRFVPPGKTNGSGTFILERQSVSETLIEEFDEETVGRNIQGVFRAMVYRRTVWALSAIGAFAVILVATYLYSQSVTSRQKIRKVAVLPLLAIGDESEKALGLGFAESLITELGELEDISVISINAVSRFAAGDSDPLEAGRKLDVDAVISGSLQKVSGRVRVTLRLVRVADGKQLWAESFDEPDGKVFFLQDLIANSARRTLAIQPAIRSARRNPTENLEAYDLYLQGEYLFRLRETSRAGARFKRAVEIDPSFAEAWSGLAAAYAMGDSMPEADDIAAKALALDPNLAEGHAVRGFINIFLKWDWKQAEQSLDRALLLKPNLLEAHHWRGTLYTILGRHSEAAVSLHRALELDPMSANILADLGYTYLAAGDFKHAEDALMRSRAIERRYSDRALVHLYRMLGREDSALETLAESRCRASEAVDCANRFRIRFQAGGFREIAARDLREAEDIMKNDKPATTTPSGQWYWIAVQQAGLGKNREAIRSLQKSLDSKQAFEIGNFTLPYLASDPNFRHLRGNPDFSAILAKLGLQGSYVVRNPE